MKRALLALLLSVLPIADAFAQAAAVDKNRENCLETEATGTMWSATSQLHCLKPDPQRTRMDPFGRCQERRFEVTMRNRCDFMIISNWRFNNGMRLKQQVLGPNQIYVVNCGQLSDQCDGSVIAYGETVR
ncbi:MAG: hypothetical protein JO021_05610 [Alphaproteobacteria bacterium]|nr:hypothetical protein [Alphaproteobacteria bacterium]